MIIARRKGTKYQFLNLCLENAVSQIRQAMYVEWDATLLSSGGLKMS